MTTRTWVLTTAIVCTALIVSLYLSQQSSPAERPLIPVASAEDVLEHIRAGKRVVFVDAREAPEYLEERIPGAINLTLREVQLLDPRTLGDPDLVIAYCIKDFRGFEVARALDRAGVENVHVLADVGIQGWKKRGLPTEKGRVARSTPVSSVLLDCAADVVACLKR